MAGFADFIKHRKYFVCVSPATLDWYKSCFRSIPECPTQADLQNAVIAMRERGLKPTGINSAITCWNAYTHWLAFPETKCGPGCQHPKLTRLKEPQNNLAVYSEQQINRLVTYKPNTAELRTHLIMLFLFDVGARISEVLSLCADSLDFENMLVRLDGKGSKTRIVPFSAELRKRLVRYVADAPGHRLVFATRNGTKLERRSVLRSVKRLCRKVGFEPPARTLHAARHSFASNYLRKGGNAIALQRTLGHADLTTTQRYCHLAVADLQAAHQRISLLAR
ncbi:tyrosine-type recombinase/integrase [Granulicella sp. L46]|uniref:tyrosine-type recombinase/integrase n=1 Tax=Granulicella sp. L46 TaxID=1641865 RepID=UPI00131AD6DE|nr:tyrosine-type recombinase/integrase [Granulicella sp. L46]